MNPFRSSYFRTTARSLAFGALIFSAARLLAEETITLDALVAEALANNPELKFYEAEVAAAKGERRAAGEWANPELSAELGNKRVEDLSGNKLGDGAVWSVSVAQTFEFPGRVSLRKAIAGKQIELANLGLEQFRVALAAQVRSLGFKVLAAEEKATAAREVSSRFHSFSMCSCSAKSRAWRRSRSGASSRRVRSRSTAS